MSRKLRLSPVAEAEQRMDAWVLAAGVEPLEADWVAIRFELLRLREAIAYATDRKNYHGSTTNSVSISQTAYARLNGALEPNAQVQAGPAGFMAGIAPATDS